MRSLTGLTQGRVLDIGSGYGFFRVALRDAGYEQEGLEVSAFARAVAESSTGSTLIRGSSTITGPIGGGASTRRRCST